MCLKLYFPNQCPLLIKKLSSLLLKAVILFKSFKTVVYLNVHKNSISTYHITQSMSIIMLFMETVTVYCETQMKHVIRPCGESADFLKIAAVGTYNYH
jgi:hypothetical protein